MTRLLTTLRRDPPTYCVVWLVWLLLGADALLSLREAFPACSTSPVRPTLALANQGVLRAPGGVVRRGDDEDGGRGG